MGKAKTRMGEEAMTPELTKEDHISLVRQRMALTDWNLRMSPEQAIIFRDHYLTLTAELEKARKASEEYEKMWKAEVGLRLEADSRHKQAREELDQMLQDIVETLHDEGHSAAAEIIDSQRFYKRWLLRKEALAKSRAGEE